MPPARILALLNAQRAAHGIPAGIRLVADWTAKCRAHDNWMAVNNRIQHPEDPGTPAYSEGGNWAGTHAVLAQGTDWRDGNPWETAPIHLIQLLGPALARVGADESKGFECVTTWPGYERTGAANVVYTYPAGGTKSWRPSEVARESPFTPQEKVGIPEGTRTGPTLYVLPDGPWTKAYGTFAVTAASLAPAAGGAKLALRVVDKRNKDVGPYMPPGAAMLIPVRPLKGGAAYTASVTLRGPDGTELTKTWSFTTAQENAVGQDVRPQPGGGFVVAVTSTAPGPVLTLDGKRVPVTRQGGAWVTAPLSGRSSFLACVSSGGGASGWVAARLCETWRIG